MIGPVKLAKKLAGKVRRAVDRVTKPKPIELETPPEKKPNLRNNGVRRRLAKQAKRLAWNRERWARGWVPSIVHHVPRIAAKTVKRLAAAKP